MKKEQRKHYHHIFDSVEQKEKFRKEAKTRDRRTIKDQLNFLVDEYLNKK